MKALSFTQPWASLVAVGVKQIETRSWSTSYRGVIAIHAAKTFPSLCQQLVRTEPFQSALVRGDNRPPERYQMSWRSLPLGRIIAVATLTRVLPTERIWFDLSGLSSWPTHPHDFLAAPSEEPFGDYAPDRFAWILSDVQRLPETIPCNGARRLWEVPPDVEARIRALVPL